MDVWEFHETFECRAWPANDRHKLRQAKEQSKDWTAKSERGRSEICPVELFVTCNVSFPIG